MGTDIYAHLTQEDYDNEVWKDIQNYVGLYQISNLGRVKSLARPTHGGKRLSRERILNPGHTPSTYANVTLCGQVKKMYQVHRLTAMAFIPNTENKPQVNHINGIKLDNRVVNLEWATASENNFHAVRTGLKKSSEKQRQAAINVNSGENSHNSVLTDFEVSEIRRLYATGIVTMKELALDFGCCAQTICNIINYKTRAKPTPVLEAA